jgi:hypothetical protein
MATEQSASARVSRPITTSASVTCEILRCNYTSQKVTTEHMLSVKRFFVFSSLPGSAKDVRRGKVGVAKSVSVSD